MIKIRKNIITICLIVAIIVGGMAYGAYWAFYDIQRIKGQQYIMGLTSPDGTYTVSAYLNNGGATTSYSVLGVLKNNINNESKNIYWQYRCDNAEIEWISNDTIKINGIRLQVEDEVYDYRRE